MTKFVPELLEWHRDLAIEALQSLSWQFASAARLLSLGDIAAGVEAYRRGRDIDRDFLVAGMCVLRDASQGEVETSPSSGPSVVNASETSSFASSPAEAAA